jgi:hypothetical protein
VVTALCCAIACSSAAPLVRHTFAPNEHVARRGDVQLELAAVGYQGRRVTLSVGLSNRNEVPIQVAHEGILLRYEELEYPLEVPPVQIADPIVVGPGGRLDVDLRFRLGPPLLHDATLMLRTVKRGDTWIEGLHVRVPGPTSTEKRDQQAT